MLAVQLERSWDGLDGHRIGPVDGLRIDGLSLRVLPLNVEILRFIADYWRIDNQRFTGLTIESPTLIYVERSRRLKGQFYGPFDFVRLSRMKIYTSEDARQTFSQFNILDGNWHLCHDNTHWPRIILLPSAQTEF